MDDRRKPDQATVRVRPSQRGSDLASDGPPTKPLASDLANDGPATRPLAADGPATKPIGAAPPEPAWPGGPTHPRGTLLGRYVVLSLLGAGGMGEVYTAYDPALDRRVALKVIKPLADKGSMSTARNLLLSEAQALAKLSHPNIVGVYDVGTIDDDVYIAMEYVEGLTLTKWLGDERTRDEIIHTFVAAGRGLAAAHAAGIVHRDFKPDNVLIGKDGRVRVIDFGIALRGPADEPEGIVGTPAFMAPEQFMRAKVGPASDQFSFAVALYGALYGQHAFEGDTEATIAFNICEGNVITPPTGAGVPARIRDAILRALSRTPALRHPSMNDLLVALEPPAKRARWPYAIAGAVVLAAVSTIGFVATRSSGPEPCTGFERDLSGVWDPVRKLALQAQVKPDAWAPIEKMFDSYARDWVRNKRNACRATVVTHEQTPQVLERRMNCLDTRRRELDAAITIVSAGGAATQRAIEIGSNLRSPAACANLSTLAPLPQAPGSAIADVEAAMAQVRAKRLAGQFDDARAAAGRVIEKARAISWRGAVARMLVERGLSESADGDPTAARDTFFEAIRASSEAGDAASEADAWIGLVSVEAQGLRRPSEGMRWAQHAELALRKAGNDQEQQGELLHSIAGALRVLDRHEESLDHERRALALFEHAFGAHHVRVANQRAAVSTALRQNGKLDEAVSEAEAALVMLEELVGLTHPYVASLLNGLALTYGEAQRVDDARKALERAIVIGELELGAGHLRLANPLMNLVALERRAGRAAEAEALWERAYEIRKSNLGPTHPDVTRALHGKLLDRINRGLDSEARALIDEVITRQRARTDALELASALSLRCELERREGQLAKAKATCAEAIGSLSQPVDPGRALYVYAYAARVAAQRGETVEARKLIDQAEGFVARATRDLAVARGVVGWAATHVLLVEGKRAEAVARAAEARASFLSHGKNYGYLTGDLERVR